MKAAVDDGQVVFLNVCDVDEKGQGMLTDEAGLRSRNGCRSSARQGKTVRLRVRIELVAESVHFLGRHGLTAQETSVKSRQKDDQKTQRAFTAVSFDSHDGTWSTPRA